MEILLFGGAMPVIEIDTNMRTVILFSVILAVSAMDDETIGYVHGLHESKSPKGFSEKKSFFLSKF